MDNKIKALIIINNKVNERIKSILYKEPQEEKMMFEGIRDVLQMTSELTERIERISDDFINKETLLNCLSSELQSYIYDLSETDLDRMIYITLYAEKLKLSIEKLNLEFYYDDLLEEGFSDFAVVNGKIKSCLYVPCDKCEFKKKDCSKDRITWLLSQRKKPKYKFTQFEYDLINTYRHVDDRCKFNGCYQLKSLKEKGYFNDVNKNDSIKDILESCEVIK